MSTPSELLDQIGDIGTDHGRGGYSRHVFQPVELELREWFTAAATERGLTVSGDHNGNLWAWWGEPGPNALVTGSHLDSVPGGGAFDGPLGVASALAAVDELRASGFTPNRPLALVVFAEEEGGRFGVPCLGSRLLTGSIDADHARRLRDPDGVSLAEAAAYAGLDPAALGADERLLGNLGCFIELHVEQGRGLIDQSAAVGVASSILAHGRWRFRFTGEGNHAGATLLEDRKDPMLPAARFVLAAREAARAVPGARATVGRIVPNPGGTNVIASSADVWLDARASTAEDTRAMLAEIEAAAADAATSEGCTLNVSEESYSDTVYFDTGVRDELVRTLGDVPVLPTGAGHDAGILAARIPTGMLFVRNPTGISHAPEEFAERDDCTAGARALATVLREQAGG
ncbi:N-carbamoyl-L-amino-acid hydrolase [Tamaricihabitans halophyticus]|uniref:N-carbamoyl-L-amino-acid hydrolase n=1 Tax=Tamaricihabitans halophyticus TaxID=1262583 RepID=A0A4R2QQB6_9PSEU|nr:allantoate amidohydrolase [Tamaricihabitans halophyticus]TCP51933.1 N-carbamoyl-L-amino-acid hydrolase [Tamaricihabitans halophyticus]